MKILYFIVPPVIECLKCIHITEYLILNTQTYHAKTFQEIIHDFLSSFYVDYKFLTLCLFHILIKSSPGRERLVVEVSSNKENILLMITSLGEHHVEVMHHTKHVSIREEIHNPGVAIVLDQCEWIN